MVNEIITDALSKITCNYYTFGVIPPGKFAIQPGSPYCTNAREKFYAPSVPKQLISEGKIAPICVECPVLLQAVMGLATAEEISQSLAKILFSP